MPLDKINHLRMVLGICTAGLYIGITLCNILTKDYRTAGISFLFAIVNFLLFALD